MNGRIWIDETCRKGTLFNLHIPTEWAAEPVTPDLRPLDNEGSGSGTFRVLVVEDDPASCELMTIFLQKINCTVIRVEDGFQAIEKCNDTALDIVFLDLKMPGMSGYEVARILRETGLQIPIVAVTAQAFPTDLAACLEAGMNDCLAKPIQLQDVRAVIKRLLEDNVQLAG